MSESRKGHFIFGHLFVYESIGIQHVYCTSWYFKNHSQLSMYSRNLQSAIKTYSMYVLLFGKAEKVNISCSYVEFFEAVVKSFSGL